VAELRQKRLHDCRLTSDRKLETLEEARNKDDFARIAALVDIARAIASTLV